MILSVGYRVNSRNATYFRKWASAILKDYLLRGYAINPRLEQLEKRVAKTALAVSEWCKNTRFDTKTALTVSECRKNTWFDTKTTLTVSEWCKTSVCGLSSRLQAARGIPPPRFRRAYALRHLARLRRACPNKKI